MIWIYVFVFVVALSAAFIAQLVLPPQRRTRIIFAAAAAPSAMLIFVLLIFAIFLEPDLNWFQVAVSLALHFISYLFVGLVAAIVGSEFASLSLWLRARQKKQQ